MPKICEVVIFDKTKLKTMFVQTFDHPHNIVMQLIVLLFGTWFQEKSTLYLVESQWSFWLAKPHIAKFSIKRCKIQFI